MTFTARAGLATADVLESGELVVRPTSDDLRAELADFVRRAGKGATRAVWTEVPGPPRSPTLVLELRSGSGHDVFHLGLTFPAELWRTAPRGPLTVALALGDEVGDPDEGVLVDGVVVATPPLER
jgi:hypothetical protein